MRDARRRRVLVLPTLSRAIAGRPGPETGGSSRQQGAADRCSPVHCVDRSRRPRGAVPRKIPLESRSRPGPRRMGRRSTEERGRPDHLLYCRRWADAVRDDGSGPRSKRDDLRSRERSDLDTTPNRLINPVHHDRRATRADGPEHDVPAPGAGGPPRPARRATTST